MPGEYVPPLLLLSAPLRSRIALAAKAAATRSMGD